MKYESIYGIVFNSEKVRYEKAEIRASEDGGHLEGLQKVVDGLIEMPYVSEELRKRNIDIVINEEGLYREDFDVTAVVIEDNKVIVALKGPILFIGHDGEGGSISLSKEQEDFILKEMNKVGAIGDANGNETMGVLILPN